MKTCVDLHSGITVAIRPLCMILQLNDIPMLSNLLLNI